MRKEIDSFSPITLFFVYIIFVLLLAALVTALILRYRLSRRGMVSRSLNLELIAVRFISEPPQQEQTLQQIREKIALMEQFYSNLLLVKDKWWKSFLYGMPVFALELTIPSFGEELSFYIAVPRRFCEPVMKIIQGIFPNAHVEETRDYNIFNPDGFSVASRAKFARGKYYPVKTYQKLEGDPMKLLTNVFTQLEKIGEGAALQIIARPAAKKWKKKLTERAQNLFRGKSGESALAHSLHTLGKEQSQESKMAQQKTQEMKRLTPREEEIVRALESKAGKPLFEANIRLLASAKTKERAETILHGLELSFAQFSDPNTNNFVFERAKKKTLDTLIFNFSFRNFNEKQLMIISAEELTSVFHFPNVFLETPHVRRLKAREAPPPVNLPREGLILGYNEFRGKASDIFLLDEDRRRHLYIIGQTGTGKTTFMEGMIAQDIQNGKGVAIIDPHGELIDRLLGIIPRHRYQEVVYFNPGDVAYPMGLNMLEYDPNYPEQKTFIVNELLSIFDKLYNMSVAGGPMFEQYFRNATLLVMDDPQSGNTLLEIQRVMVDKEFRDLKLSRSKNIVVKSFWKDIAEKAGGEASLKDIVPYIASKFDNFIANEIMRPVIAQQKSAFNIREIMDSQKILLVNLSKGRLGELNSSLIGLIMVGKLLMAALSRVDMPEERRRDYYLYIDEFQNVTTDSISTILSEARKYRLNLTIAHQFIGQLKEEIKKAVFGNVGSMASFRIGTEDAEFLAKQFKPVFSEQDLINIDNFNCYIKPLIEGATVSAFSMKIKRPEKGSGETAEIVKEISRAKYGRPREEVEREIEERYGKI
ncbi:MAG: type IV secretory system conjugative DNA transfer family protein [Candidatus Colwellbacteria bacterium]|nr:type IV secretory system conjugative DNA transfer family protein [Candidatus Colwellbacteria bacterium]